jgi:hypothetical protein
MYVKVLADIRTGGARKCESRPAAQATLFVARVLIFFLGIFAITAVDRVKTTQANQHSKN